MDVNGVTRFWLSIDQERRRVIAAEMLDRMGPDLRSLLVEALARAMRMRSISLHRRPVPKLAPDLALHFTRLPFREQMIAVAAVFTEHPRMSDFNAAIGFDAESPDSLAASSGFQLSDLDSYRGKHGAEVLRLALAYVSATSSRGPIQAAASRALRELEAELDQNQRRRASGELQPPPGSMQERPADLTATHGGEADAHRRPSSAQDAAASEQADQPAALPNTGEEGDPDSPACVDGAEQQGESPPSAVERIGKSVDALEGSEIPVAAGAVDSSTEADALESDPSDWMMRESRDEELDRLVIRAVVAHASGEYGAMRADEIRRLVDGLIALNTGRYRSYFHLGFSDALLGGEAQQTESGINQPRRAWYLCGFLLGKRRQIDDETFLERIDQLSESDHESLRSAMAIAAVRKLGPTVVEAAFASRRYALAAEWLMQCGAYDKGIAERATRTALREPSDDAEENQSLLSNCIGIRQQAADRLEAPSILDPVLELALSLAGSLWQQGGVAAARGFMAEGGFSKFGAEGRWIDAQLRYGLRRADELIPADVEQLERLALHFATVEDPDEGGLPAYSILRDLYGWLHRSANGVGDAARTEAAALLGRAQECRAALHMDAARRARHGLIRATELAEILDLLSAIVACIAGDDAEVRDGAARVDRWLHERGRLPRPLLRQVLENAIIAGSPDSASLHRGIVQRYGAEAIDLTDLGTVASNPGAREAFMALLRDTEMLAPEKRWSLSRAIGRAVARGAVDTELARRCGDELCELAESRPQQFGSDFMQEFSGEPWSDVYDEEELESRLISVAELRGEYEDVGQFLQRQLARALAEGALPLANDCVELLDARGLGGFVSTEQRVWLASQMSAAASSREIAAGRPVRILFVGGNEVQARWDDEVRSEVARQAPGVGVDFIHSGWGSNWGVFVAEVERKVDQCSAIVLMRFVRTILGEKVRRIASDRDKPWIACSGHGKASVERAILEAARVARSR